MGRAKRPPRNQRRQLRDFNNISQRPGEDVATYILRFKAAHTAITECGVSPPSPLVTQAFVDGLTAASGVRTEAERFLVQPGIDALKDETERREHLTQYLTSNYPHVRPTGGRVNAITDALDPTSQGAAQEGSDDNELARELVCALRRDDPDATRDILLQLTGNNARRTTASPTGRPSNGNNRNGNARRRARNRTPGPQANTAPEICRDFNKAKGC